MKLIIPIPMQSNSHHLHRPSMATPVSPKHRMTTTTPTSSSPQSPMTTLGNALAVNLQPRTPTVAQARSSAATTVWQVDKTLASSKPKPKRPYTPYNLFYLLERELVVQKTNGPPSMKRKLTDTVPRPEDQVKFPSRYDGIVMGPYWYDPNMKEKRKHRKTHGSISFKELTGIIASNWATVDEETKEYVTTISEIGRNRYKEEMSRFNAYQKIIQLQKEHANMTADTTAAEPLKKQPTLKKNVQVGSPVRRKGSLKRKPIPVTPDRTFSNLPIAHRPKPSPPVVTPPHRYNLPNLPMYQFQPFQLPSSLPPTMTPPTMPSPPVMPLTMSSPPITIMPPSPYHQRPRQFEHNRPVKRSKKDFKSTVGKDATISSSGEGASQDEALQLSSLMEHEFMSFEPDHVTDDVFEDNVKATFDSPVPKNVEDEDILDMIKGDMWNLDHFYDEDPFPFLVD